MTIKERQVGRLKVKQYDSRREMGEDAAQLAGQAIISLLRKQDKVTMIFASAPSQSEFLAALARNTAIDWSRIEAFHMDEYIGLAADHPQSFATFLNTHLFDLVPIGKFHAIHGDAPDVQEECKRYAALLLRQPIDIICLGIGENTHIAFNDPHVADFKDPQWVKVIDLDDKSRQQQVNDGCFPSVDAVPTHAITLTIPALFRGNQLYCMVPGKNKSQAVRLTLSEEISEKYPSTILREHPDAILFIDQECAAGL